MRALGPSRRGARRPAVARRPSVARRPRLDATPSSLLTTTPETP
jgi:hypothetical protein